jgi:hypothetical protein
VSYSLSATGQDSIVKCNYCNSSLTEPKEMLGRSAHVVAVKIGRGGKHLMDLANPPIATPGAGCWLHFYCAGNISLFSFDCKLKLAMAQ